MDFFCNFLAARPRLYQYGAPVFAMQACLEVFFVTTDPGVPNLLIPIHACIRGTPGGVVTIDNACQRAIKKGVDKF
jgi:hypothetical protein